MKALDYVLVGATGAGLDHYAPDREDPRPLQERPTLSLHIDEGSPGYAMAFYCINHLRSRMVVTRDIFHREWNDCNMALHQSSLYWIVLLTRIPFNMAYGPWNGSSWWQNVRLGARRPST